MASVHQPTTSSKIITALADEVEGCAHVFLRALDGTKEHTGNVGTICLLAKRRHVVPILMTPCP
jgi:hypothetical protein